jgi:hypothetical protein
MKPSRVWISESRTGIRALLGKKQQFTIEAMAAMMGSGKILSIGLGDLASGRNAALRSAGFDVVAAISLEDVFRLCGASRFDLAIVGHAFSIAERAEFVRCTQRDFRLPVILIDEGRIPGSLRADSHVHVDASTEELVGAIHWLTRRKAFAAAAAEPKFF